MPKSICPRNSIFQRLPLNWGENIPRYFLSCSRVLNAIMLSFPMSVPLGGLFCPWHYTTPSKWNRLFAYFTSENASCPIESGIRPVSGVKYWGYSSAEAIDDKVWRGESAAIRSRHRPMCIFSSFVRIIMAMSVIFENDKTGQTCFIISTLLAFRVFSVFRDSNLSASFALFAAKQFYLSPYYSARA